MTAKADKKEHFLLLVFRPFRNVENTKTIPTWAIGITGCIAQYKTPKNRWNSRWSNFQGQRNPWGQWGSYSG